MQYWWHLNRTPTKWARINTGMKQSANRSISWSWINQQTNQSHYISVKDDLDYGPSETLLLPMQCEMGDGNITTMDIPIQVNDLFGPAAILNVSMGVILIPWAGQLLSSRATAINWLEWTVPFMFDVPWWVAPGSHFALVSVFPWATQRAHPAVIQGQAKHSQRVVSDWQNLPQPAAVCHKPMIDNENIWPTNWNPHLNLMVVTPVGLLHISPYFLTERQSSVGWLNDTAQSYLSDPNAIPMLHYLNNYGNLIQIPIWK